MVFFGFSSGFLFTSFIVQNLEEDLNQESCLFNLYQNSVPCSAYYRSLDELTSHIAHNQISCVLLAVIFSLDHSSLHNDVLNRLVLAVWYSPRTLAFRV